MPSPTRRRLLAALATAPLALGLAACGDDGGTAATTSTTTPALTLVPVTATTAPAGEPVDQTPPTTTNGLAFVDDVLWVASLRDDELLGVDPDTGTIVGRLAVPAGSGPDDLALGPDGRLWWTGFTSGVVGTADPATGAVEVAAELAPGANPIAFGADGRLFVGLAVTADALYELDPSGGTDPRLVVDGPGNVNGFAVADDGRIWGPRFGGAGTGAIVAIDPDTGEVEVLTEGLSADVALAIGPDGRAYVVTVAPTTVQVWDPATDELATYAELPSAAADNLAFRGDGSLYVSTFDQPTLVVVDPDGEVRTVTIGR